MADKNLLKRIVGMLWSTKQGNGQEIKSQSSSYALNNLISPYSMAGRFGWSDIKATACYEYYKQISVIRNAIDLSADTFKTVDVAIKDIKRNELIREYDSRIPATGILKLLSKPNQDKSASDFQKYSNNSYNVTGNTFWVVSLDAQDMPTEITWINPKNVTENTDAYSIASSYIINNGRMTGSYVRKEDDYGRVIYRNGDNLRDRHLWVMKCANPDEGCGTSLGISPLSGVYYEIETFAGTSKHNNSLLKNGVRPSGVAIVNSPTECFDKLDDDQISSIKQNISSYYSGAENAGNVMILDGIKEFKQLSLTNKDMEFGDLRKSASEQIYKNLNIPLPLVTSSSMTYSNYEESKYMLYDMNTIPFAIEYCDELNRFLMPFYDDSGEFELVPDIDNIDAIKRRNIESMKSLEGYVTVNEMRNKIDLEDIEGGDVIKGFSSVVETESISSKKMNKESFIDQMRDTGLYEEHQIQAKADMVYGTH
jgi:HK97 family phage portal protein